jgi:hypothetical protein
MNNPVYYIYILLYIILYIIQMCVVLDGIYKYTANYNTTEWNLSKQQKVILLLHKATSFDPTMGSSSSDYIRIKETKSK